MRIYKNRMYSPEADIVNILGTISIGASGAVSNFSGGNISNVVKESADGQYSITLSEKYQRLLSVQVMPVIAASQSGVATIEILEAPASLQTDFKADSTFKIQLYDASLAAVNAASGTQLILDIKVRRSSVGPFDE